MYGDVYNTQYAVKVPTEKLKLKGSAISALSTGAGRGTVLQPP